MHAFRLPRSSLHRFGGQVRVITATIIHRKRIIQVGGGIWFFRAFTVSSAYAAYDSRGWSSICRSVWHLRASSGERIELVTKSLGHRQINMSRV
jgi:hypothetical protein